ncbi:hypothetical protein A2810_01515 [candidate division Kazan bacterium RIFCSPHIGHO2_01_FULL_49_10]|uniref:Lipoprotein signal peptidase n=1 Tax=candidate division Kazan bacterium RIFCSPLOWO2_01_FULL_48_13 TaxID=1798539 RepID=A0A1F4PP80_UNCK3|nr:MAG: hypothetical protein A2810_01515 [candidate division Kazan bacterium RIFCSPHIGHO2_01_FULL_49_10]OGB85491.1 MAG: hypothetical protein A2994_01505 [candidate division Kazan bacterium RIFCSPLOWO2_01_FULL_48_13]
MIKLAHKLLCLVFGGGFLVAADQFMKYLIWPEPFRSPVIPADQYWWLTQHQNYGISFGIELPYYLSVGLMSVFLLLLLWLFFQRSTSRLAMELGLILSIAGGLSNLIDRINLGFVRDFVTLSFWLPIFNVADVLVVSGVLLILIETYRHGRT